MPVDKNQLYPIFLKLSQLNVLIVGGGYVGFEKLSFMLKSSPEARVTLLSKEFSESVKQLAEAHRIPMIQRAYTSNILHKKHLVIAATDDVLVNKQIYHDAKARNILVNVADTPAYCDFYLGGVVTKGNLKLAISTNGKSPTFAKRLRQFFEETLPEDLDDLIENLHQYRATLQGELSEKTEILNKHTSLLIKENHDQN